MQVSLEVNGQQRTLDVADNTLLVEALRGTLRLTGTHVGCDTSQCGACTVHVNGEVVKACNVLVGQLDGARITTIEGIGSVEALHPMQAAFREHHGLQCGFCTPGMIMTAIGIAQRHPGGVDEATVRSELDGNLCRCTGYHNIVAAVLDGSAKMQGAGA